MTAPVDPWLDRELDGRYRLVRRLGGGGMGTVYVARQLSIGREVAIKVVRPELIGDRAAIRRFLHEVAVAARLHSPHTITVFDFGEAADGTLYLVTELVPGRDLAAELAAHGPMSPARACRLGIGICDGLAAIDGAGVIHRDLKPSNVLVVPGPGERELAKVIDFGIARSPQLSAVTASGDVIGTPDYVAPEAIRGEAVDARADLYALGCVLCALVRGRPPFVAADGPVLDQHLRAAPPAVPEAGPLAPIVTRLLAKDPAARYPDALAVRAALEACAAQLAARPRSRRPGFVVGLGLAVLAVLAVALAWRRPWRREAPSRRAVDAVAAPRPVDAAVAGVDAQVPIDAAVTSTSSVDAAPADDAAPPRSAERPRDRPPRDLADGGVPRGVPVDAAPHAVDARVPSAPPIDAAPPMDARLRRTDFLDP